MTDAETAERGYLITGEDVSLAPYEAGLATFREAIETALDEAPDGRVRRLLEAEIDADVAAELRPRVSGRGLELTVDAAPAVVHGDRDHLERVLFNLVGNALKFTPDGGEVAVVAGRDDDEVVLAVRDSGIGIPEEEIDRLFDRFFRASTATDRAIPGTGLGVTGEAGIDQLRRTPDLLLLDLMMPGLTGIEVCQTLRAEERFADVPMVLLTARAQERDVSSGLAAGATAYVSKPFSPRGLLEELTPYLGRTDG